MGALKEMVDKVQAFYVDFCYQVARKVCLGRLVNVQRSTH